MTLTDFVIEPIPITLIAGRYLLFDIDAVTHLRRIYNICGVLIGGLPQIPQQNVFLGLPVELLPEEVMCLVRKGVANIVDDAAWHREKFGTLKGAERKLYLDTLKAEGRKAQKLAGRNSHRKTERGLTRQATLQAPKGPVSSDARIEACNSSHPPTLESETTLSGNQRPYPALSLKASTSAVYTVTTTVTYSPLSRPQSFSQWTYPPVPVSYPLFAHLHTRGYFVTPGLRFGCDYTVYPGDPLRFHSHFLAVGYDWDTEIPLLDMVGGGRLGTGVKKGFLIGGEDPAKPSDNGETVRTFCIEWGGM